MRLKKIECLNRLFDTIRCRNDILQFLKDEKLITQDNMDQMLHEHHTQHASRIATLLDDLLQADKLQLVDYSWTILPREYVCLSLVSKQSKKDFVYSI